MENSGNEFGVVDYLRLMTAFLEGSIDARAYTRGYFDLTNRRVNIPNEEVQRITQQAYGDADDYEPDTELRRTNSQWIGELQLRERVAKSLRKLEALGYQVER
jgi:hypothetical protein